jgi:hypothetical protein
LQGRTAADCLCRLTGLLGHAGYGLLDGVHFYISLGLIQNETILDAGCSMIDNKDGERFFIPYPLSSIRN